MLIYRTYHSIKGTPAASTFFLDFLEIFLSLYSVAVPFSVGKWYHVQTLWKIHVQISITVDCFALNETVAGTNKFGKLGILRQSTAFSEKKRRQIKLHFQNRGYALERKRSKRSESFPFSAR